MASTIVLPQGTYPIGTRTLGPANVPQGVSSVELQLDGTQMTDPALHLTVGLDLSLDGGATWASTNPGVATDPFPVAMETQGGSKTRTGAPVPIYNLGTNIPSPSSSTRQIKATVTITGTPLTTKGTLVLL